MTEAKITAAFSVTPSQQGFLIGSLREGAVFVEQATVELHGEVDAGRLLRSWQRLVAEQGVLRTAFVWDLKGAPRQVVFASASSTVDVVQVPPGCSDEERERQRQTILSEHRSTGLSLKKPPLVRLTLQHDKDRSCLIWTHHHAVLDGWSQAILLGDLLRCYCSPDSLLEPAPSFQQYASWSAARDWSQHEHFWSQRLSGYIAPPRIAAQQPHAAADRFGTHYRRVAGRALDALSEYSDRAGLTKATLLAGAALLLAARLRNAHDAVIGVTTSGRCPDFTGADRVVGPLSCTVPCRAEVTSGGNSTTWLQQLQQQLADAAPFSDCSTGQVHRWASLPADRSLFDIVLAVANYPGLDESDAPLRVRPNGITGGGGRTMQPLSIVVTMGSELVIRVVNDRSRISDEHASALADRFLDSLVQWPQSTTLELAGDHETVSLAIVGEQERSTCWRQPSGSIEIEVVETFAKVLGITELSPDADFFEVGGHSLLAVEALERLQSTFAVLVTLTDLLKAPTASSLASVIRRRLGSGEAPEPLPQISAIDSEPSGPFPLGDIQQAYWVGRQLNFDLGGVDSHIYAEIDIPGLDCGRLEDSWNALIARHPMLRVVFTADGQQVVLDTVPRYQIRVSDASASDAAEQVASQRRRLRQPTRSLTEWPLFDIEASSLGHDVTRLFISFDLLIGDAQSWQVLYRELAKLYRDPSATLEPLTLTYRRYLEALEALRSTERYARDREYWRDRVATLPAAPPLVLAAPICDLHDMTFGRRQLQLSQVETETLRTLAAEMGSTPAALLLAVFERTLGRFTGTSEFLLNLTVFSRLQMHSEVNDLVGDFTSLSLLHVQLPKNGDLLETCKSLQRRLWEDLDHRLYGGLEVLRDLRRARGDQRGAPAPVVFTSTLDLTKHPDDPGPVPGKIVHGIGQTPQVLLDYQTYEVAGELTINWDALEAAFPPGYLDAMFEDHATALRACLDGQTQVGTEVEVPDLPPLGGGQLLHDPFVAHARTDPGAPAVICGEKILTYGDLLRHSQAVAAAVLEADCGGAPVGIVMHKGWEQIVAAIGVGLAGRAFVPIDADWPSTRIDSVMTKTRSRLALTQTWTDVRIPAHVTPCPVDRLDPQAGAAATIPAPRMAAHDPAYVIFTSGSTGTPKGVVIQHQAALNTILDVNERFGVSSRDRVLGVSSLTFDLSIYDVFGILAAGGAVVLPQQQHRMDPAVWAKLIRRHRVTIWNSVPVLLDLMLDSRPAADSLESLRLCLLSGDWIPLSLPDAAREQAPAAKIVSLGGATEGSIWSILFEVDAVDPGWLSIPYGYAMHGQAVCVVDDQGRPCPPWVTGNIVIAGNGVALGYWDEPGLTDEAFYLHPETGQRIYRTGDRGRLLPSGAIEFLGRRDSQVKVGGHRIELHEVEAALLSCRGVEHGAVIAIGEHTERRLAGFFVGPTTVGDVEAQLARLLPRYMVPSVLRPLDSMPLSPTGKVDRRALAELRDTAQPHAQSLEQESERARAVPAKLARCAHEVLGFTPDDDANLLALGLSSVDVIRFINLVHRTYGHRAEVADFYRNPTLLALANSLPNRQSEHADARLDPWAMDDVIVDSKARSSYRDPGPVLARGETSARCLPPPQLDASDFHTRRSARRFGNGCMELSHVADILHGLSRLSVQHGGRYLYPSAGGLYCVDAFVEIRHQRVHGVDAGLYYYDPHAHDLVDIVQGVDLSPGLHLGQTNAPLADSAAFVVFLVTDPARSVPVYGTAAEHLNLLNAGYLGHHMTDLAVRHGVAACPLDGYDFDAVRWLFPYAERAVLLHMLAFGPPAPIQLRGSQEMET